MRNTAAASLLALLVLAATPASAQTAQDLFPNQDGNAWTYEVRGQIGNGSTRQVSVTARSGGWAQVTGLEGDHWLWMSAQSGRVWAWDASSGTYGLLFDLAAARGTQFSMQIPAAPCLNRSRWEVSKTAATVDTPVGRFTDCVVIDNVQPVCADAGIESMTFAPGVGLVAFAWTTIAGPHTAVLAHAMVDGREHKPRSSFSGGFAVRLATDRFAYTVTDDRKLPVPPGGRPLIPDTLQLRFEVANETGETITWHQSSGQAFDVVIRNDAGDEVYRWSDGRFFTMALVQRTLLPGEVWAVEQAIELRGKNGEALPAGDYSLEAVQTLAGPRPRALSRFKIELRIAN